MYNNIRRIYLYTHIHTYTYTMHYILNMTQTEVRMHINNIKLNTPIIINYASITTAMS